LVEIVDGSLVSLSPFAKWFMLHDHISCDTCIVIMLDDHISRRRKKSPRGFNLFRCEPRVIAHPCSHARWASYITIGLADVTVHYNRTCYELL